MTQQHHSPPPTAARIRNLAVSSLLVSAVLVLAACSSTDGDNKASEDTSASSSSKTARTTSADPQAVEKKAVLSAYDAFWTEQVKAYAQGDIKGTALKKYATKDALGGVMGDVLVMQKAGTATTGAPTHQAEVTAITLSGDSPAATVEDCLDISNWKTVKRKSGQVQPFPSNQPLRYITTAKAEKWGNQWMITKLTPDGDRTC
ncbi:hypothetical protein [Streptomyces cylindrosporus]|uniref:Secreted protein/lipoprotein n=1 Tax=Streptomyces cylindrosporus TaxID=2927583 RepID=A0ABS9Y8S5_9ACTN|nr:hypothetical protein [Streptomyces cylindrosporus]MCI3273359.1 hypothetical protein [Streptomyces cylindrosporus]